MTVRTRYRIEASISSSSSEDKDLGNLKMEQVSDAQADGGVRKNVIASGATDVDITPRQLTTTRFLFIKISAKNPNDTPVTVSIKKNSIGGEAWPIKALSGTRDGYMLVTTDSLTALYATNPGPVDMELTILAAGD